MTNTTAPLLGAISSGVVGKSEPWTRLDFRKYYVANHGRKARRRFDRSAKRTERQAFRKSVRNEEF